MQYHTSPLEDARTRTFSRRESATVSVSESLERFLVQLRGSGRTRRADRAALRAGAETRSRRGGARSPGQLHHPPHSSQHEHGCRRLHQLCTRLTAPRPGDPSRPTPTLDPLAPHHLARPSTRRPRRQWPPWTPRCGSWSSSSVFFSAPSSSTSVRLLSPTPSSSPALADTPSLPRAVLSTCLGPPLIRWARSLLAAHHAASQGSTWDGGAGGGYRSLRRRAGGLDQGRGGVEGYEMASLGADEYE